jgi:plastocyanin/uncharacterized membrane protein
VYQWWVFVHLVGVFGFLLAHGVSVGVAFQLRKERNIDRVNGLLELSSKAITPFYLSLVLLLAGGTVATFLGHLWGYGWIWASIGILVLVSVAMFALAATYFRRVRVIARAMGEGTQAVTAEEFDRVLRSPRAIVISVVGFAGLAAILYLMLFKPTLGLSPSAETTAARAAPVARTLEIAADETTFTKDRLTAPAGEAFGVAFDNQAAGVAHNVSIYGTEPASDEVFVGEIVTGPATVTYRVPALEAGRYRFVCDIHPTTMVGTLEAVFTGEAA